MLASVVFLAALPIATLTLGDAVRMARAHQPRLEESRSAAEAARARVAEARAPLFPQITAHAGYRRTTGNRVLRAGTDPRLLATQPPPTTTLYNFFNFDITATQLVYDFGQASSRLDSASATAESLAEAERATRMSVVTDVRLAYFAALGQRGLVDVARAAFDNENKHLAQAEAFVASKTRPEIDLVQARASVADAEVALIQAENGYRIAKAELNRAMGVESGIDYDLAVESLAPVPGEDAGIEGLLAEAMRRPDVVSLDRQTEAMVALERAARGSYGPTLSVEGQVNEVGTELAGVRYNYFGLVTLTWPLFQGMLTPARVNEAHANVAVTRAQAAALRQDIRLDVERALMAVRASKAVIASAERSNENAAERLRLASERYGNGIGNALELDDAIVAAASSAARAVTAKVSLSLARAQLLHAIGRMGNGE